jgi:predicted signal transduction protein with EAL and GGDEF domain
MSVRREGDLLARLGGDEFAILAEHLLGPESAKNVARRVIESLDAPIRIGGKTHSVGVAIGIALIPDDGTTRQEILRKADVALYRAKAERRSAMRFFEPKMDRHIHEHERMERELRAALAADEVRPVFEPSKALESGRLLGFEAIPRWIHAEWGEVPPPRFIATAEQCGLVHELAERLLHHACNAAGQWPPDIRLAVDLLPGQLGSEREKARLVSGLVGLGQGLGLAVAASGIVSQGDGASLLFSGCHEGQGDWVGIPASADSTLRLFAVPARSPERDAWTNS